MSDYFIPTDWTLRQVYLAFLIAADPQKFPRENGLSSEQIFAFRNFPIDTWGTFVNIRKAYA